METESNTIKLITSLIESPDEGFFKLGMELMMQNLDYEEGMHILYMATGRKRNLIRHLDKFFGTLSFTSFHIMKAPKKYAMKECIGLKNLMRKNLISGCKSWDELIEIIEPFKIKEQADEIE